MDWGEDEALWWNGPSFLGRGEEHWPDSAEAPSVITEILMARKKELCQHPLMSQLEDISSWNRAVN